MTSKRERIEGLVMTIQSAFLEHPALGLTLEHAQRRFDLDAATCWALLDTLVDARVLAHNAPGEYVRLFPRRAESRTPRHAA